LDRLTAAVWQEVAADSAQNAGVRIIERLDQYQGNGSFLAWCYVIVLNITRDRIRHSPETYPAPIASLRNYRK
jgi:DNA-directed RNA polymerase specialized sigma24 family protein